MDAKFSCVPLIARLKWVIQKYIDIEELKGLKVRDLLFRKSITQIFSFAKFLSHCRALL